MKADNRTEHVPHIPRSCSSRQMMNAMGDHSMATHKAFVPFNDLRPELDDLVGGDWSGLQGFPEWARCRVLAMRPGGPVARLMAAHAVSMKVRSTLRERSLGQGLCCTRRILKSGGWLR